MTGVSADDFKGALGSWASGVTVVTTRLNKTVYGLTASSFSSVSMDPFLVMVVIADSNRMSQMIRESGKLGISILSEGQGELSAEFSKSGREPVKSYDSFPTMEMATGCPLIEGSIATLDCELHEAIQAGTHTIMLARVVAVSSDATKKPLMYFRRGYRKLVLD